MLNHIIYSVTSDSSVTIKITNHCSVCHSGTLLVEVLVKLGQPCQVPSRCTQAFTEWSTFTATATTTAESASPSHFKPTQTQLKKISTKPRQTDKSICTNTEWAFNYSCHLQLHRWQNLVNRKQKQESCSLCAKVLRHTRGEQERESPAPLTRDSRSRELP